MRPWLWTVGVAALLVLLPVYFVFSWTRYPVVSGFAAFDVYQYFYPNMMYATRSVAEGGRGFLWNSLQLCGQPFFGISSTATLYPLHLLFLVLNADVALRVVIVLNFVIGGVGAYFLCRELGLGRTAAICGAISFELSNATIDLATWTPQVTPAYVWMPIVMLAVERILRDPSVGRAIGLGLALTTAWLVGSPQIIFMTCQLIGLRFLWEITTRRAVRPLASLAALGAGVLLPFFLGAVQLWPGIAVARESIRGAGLTMEDLLGAGAPGWSDFVRAFTVRHTAFNPFVVVPAGIAAAGIAGKRTRPIALFFAAAGLLYFLLALGPSTPVFGVYTYLPFGTLFREPLRFMWIVSFCMAVLTACGVETLLERPAADAHRVAGWAPLLAVAAAYLGLWALSSNGLRPVEVVLLGAVLGGGLLAGRYPAWRTAAAVAIAGAIAVNLVAFMPWWQIGRRPVGWSLRRIPIRRLLPDGAELWRESPTFEAVKARLTPQDRAFLVHQAPVSALGPKTGSLFGVPVVQDYDPQPSRRMAEYVVFMRLGTEMKRAGEYIYLSDGSLSRSFQRHLLDLTGARYLIVEQKADALSWFNPPLRLIDGTSHVRIYLNESALPRARFVPRVEIEPDPHRLLRRLARGTQDPRHVALVEQAPPSGFPGTPESTGEVEFLRNDPEHVTLRVRASARGFLHLADQYADGWSATVNGSPVPITRADYVFRLVEVPAGESIVDFDYAPRSVRFGVLVSTITATALIVYALRAWRARYCK
jgi:hypothetical protein